MLKYLHLLPASVIFVLAHIGAWRAYNAESSLDVGFLDFLSGAAVLIFWIIIAAIGVNAFFEIDNQQRRDW